MTAERASGTTKPPQGEHPLDRIERELDLATEKARRLAQEHGDVPLDSLICDLEMVARMLETL